MVDLLAIFRAARVMRWHTNPALAHTNDRLDAHQGRVARIILALHPSPSVALLRAALTHDDGEHAVGDVKAPAKDMFPGLREWLDGAEKRARESLWGPDPDLTAEERKWLHYADRMDAMMWCEVHAPNELTGDGWPEARRDLQMMAWELGIGVPQANTDRAQVAALGAKS
ncbi:hypothetical protein [Sagittula sp. S175]|uniref:hypothetical protein n=1 Tax=Sagittula sp. S175 TaxID=3415129 RepID=UPI003C7CDC51